LEKLMNRSRLILLGIGLAAIVIIAGTISYVTQPKTPKTIFEVLPIQTPQYDVTLEKPAPFINLSVRNNGLVNETDVVVKLSGGFSNSKGEIPGELFLVMTKKIDVIRPGETVTIPKIFNFGWYFYYRIEVSSSDGTKEVFNQWVEWRSSDVPVPSASSD
jgi:hypothetical protein